MNIFVLSYKTEFSKETNMWCYLLLVWHKCTSCTQCSPTKVINQNLQKLASWILILNLNN